MNKICYLATKALITNNLNQILLLKTDNSKRIYKAATDYWDMPGGLLDEGESEIDGLKREVSEEIGTDQLDINERILICKTKNQKPYTESC